MVPVLAYSSPTSDPPINEPLPKGFVRHASIAIAICGTILSAKLLTRGLRYQDYIWFKPSDIPISDLFLAWLYHQSARMNAFAIWMGLLLVFSLRHGLPSLIVNPERRHMGRAMMLLLIAAIAWTASWYFPFRMNGSSVALNPNL